MPLWASGWFFGRREAQLVVEQVPGDEEREVLLELARVDVLVGEDDGDVAVTGSQRSQRLRRLGLGEGHRDVGVPRAQDRERLGHEGRRRAGEGLQPHPSGAQAGDRGDLLLGGVERGEHADGVSREHLSGLGEAHLAAVALDEHGAGALLEAADHLRDGRLGEAQGVGGAREAPLVGDRLHDTQTSSIDHVSTITDDYGSSAFPASTEAIKA